MTKFPPGPWHRNIKPAQKYPVIFAGRNTHVAIVAPGLTPEQAEAVCDLITAAPEMFAALDEAINWLGVQLAISGDPRLAEVLQKCTHAFAKADGEA